MSIEAIVKEFSAVAANPKGQLKAYKDAGKKCIGVMPYYAPEELVYAAGMMPFGMWGSNSKTIQRAKEYCATFYCTIAQLDLEMLLDGTMDLLDGVITPTICDTLRPMSQNIRVAMSEKLPCIFLAHPQNRFADFGKQFCMDQYDHVKGELEKIAGHWHRHGHITGREHPPARRGRKGVTGRADRLGLQHRPEYARDSRRRSQRVVRGSLCQSRAGRLQPPARRLRALA